MSGQHEVVNFYGHAKGKEFAEFSNFYKHEPFEFVMPDFLPGFAEKETIEAFECEFTEKAIMACKAQLMGDVESFNKIIA